jgi:plasmid stability protein
MGMQYTLRNIPAAVDRALRQRAEQEGTSLNEAALRALARGVGAEAEPVRWRDLSDLAGSWREDPDFDQAIADQDVIDPEAWR